MVGHRKSQPGRRDLRGKTRFEYVHVMIDDHTRLAYAEVLPTLTAGCAVANGSAYVSHTYRRTLAELRLRHLRIRPYRPRTNGKAERFIRTLLNEWAYDI